MRTATILAIAGLLAMAPAAADPMPYFGATTHDGSYWNGPHRDYEASGPASSANHGYAQPSKGWQRRPNAKAVIAR